MGISSQNSKILDVKSKMPKSYKGTYFSVKVIGYSDVNPNGIECYCDLATRKWYNLHNEQIEVTEYQNI